MATKKELEQEISNLKNKLQSTQAVCDDLLIQHQKDMMAYETLVKQKEDFLKEIEILKNENGSFRSWLKRLF